MRKLALMLLTFFAALVVGSSPALAGKTDDAWAACIWDKVPTSASNWLKMPAPKSRYGLNETPPEYALQFRLQASCYEQMLPAGKKTPPRFEPKGVRKALEKLKPAAIKEDTVDPKAYRCTRYFLNDTSFQNPAGFDWGFGADTSKAQFVSIQYFFAAKGGSVGLPDEGGLRKCAFIQADGTFVDA